MTHFRICSFKHDKDRPLSYRRINDLLNLLQEIRRVVEKTDADYVSLRIIRDKPELQQANLPSLTAQEKQEIKQQEKRKNGTTERKS